jgi:benzil reductase ((S)-benzoin forming)
MTTLTFIAGGSKGLGRALLERCRQAGHQVKEFSRSGQDSGHIDCDMSRPEQASAVFREQFRQAAADPVITDLHLVINAATLAPFGALAGYSDREIEQHLTINIHSTMLLMQAYMQAFQDKPISKSLCYISSGAARRAIPGLGLYSASKAFFERFTDTLAEEQASLPHPVKCLIINPGVMDTGMQVEIRQQNAADFPLLPWWQELYETGQLADPADIAEVAFDLLTERGENGGYYTAQEWLKKD